MPCVIDSLIFTTSLESLHWFRSVQSKYAADEEDLREKKNALEVKRNAKIASLKQGSWFSSATDVTTPEEDEEMKVVDLMLKRLEGNRRELAMFFFNLHGSQSFTKGIRSV